MVPSLCATISFAKLMLIFSPSLSTSLSAPQSPTSQLGTRVPAQDYEKLRRQCIAKGSMFEDPYFPADDSSLFYSQKLPFKPEWKRPGVSLPSSTLLTVTVCRFPCLQGTGYQVCGMLCGKIKVQFHASFTSDFISDVQCSLSVVSLTQPSFPVLAQPSIGHLPSHADSEIKLRRTLCQPRSQAPWVRGYTVVLYLQLYCKNKHQVNTRSNRTNPHKFAASQCKSAEDKWLE